MLIVDKHTRRFIRHNKKIWRAWASKNSERIILVDFYHNSETNIARSYFLNILAKKYNAAIKSFSFREKIPYYTLHRVYRSFNVSGNIAVVLNREQRRRRDRILREIMPKLRTKEDVFNLEVLDIWIGIDIYESYLMDNHKPTVYLDDPQLQETIKEGVGLVVFWEDFFAQHKVAAVVTSHDCYLYFNVVCKVAYQNRVPVYSPNPIYMILMQGSHSIHKYFRNYRQMFKRLTVEEQEKAIALGKGQLNRRLNGEVGVDMPYATKSAFIPQQEDRKRVLRESDRIKVLICTHCFYDNPHGYGGMLFVDFYEWLKYLGKISERTDYDWYLKVHPDPLPGTEDIVRVLLKEFPRITMVPYDTSHHQLAGEGLNFILTAYGSIGGEAPALGVQVINAGYNPRIAYDFNWHPKSLEEYEYYLLNLDKLHKDINLEDIYEFYFMHHYYVIDDDFVFESYRKFQQDLTKKERGSSRAYGYFLGQLTDAKHQEVIKNMQAFIDSGKHSYYSHGSE